MYYRQRLCFPWPLMHWRWKRMSSLLMKLPWIRSLSFSNISLSSFLLHLTLNCKPRSHMGSAGGGENRATRSNGRTSFPISKQSKGFHRIARHYCLESPPEHSGNQLVPLVSEGRLSLCRSWIPVNLPENDLSLTRGSILCPPPWDHYNPDKHKTQIQCISLVHRPKNYLRKAHGHHGGQTMKSWAVLSRY